MDPTFIVILARLADRGSPWAKEFLEEYSKVMQGEEAVYTFIDPYEGEQEVRYKPIP